MIRIPEDTEHTHAEPRPHTRSGTGHRSIADVIRDLRHETLLLMRQEVALARTEMSEIASKYIRNTIYLAVGATIGLFGVLFLLLAGTAGVFIALLEGGVPTDVSLWLAPLIVGIVVGIVGYIFVQKAITTLKHASPVPRRSIESLKEDKRWLQRSMT